MKAIKRRLAVVLAVLLMIPAQPVMAVEALPDGIVTEREDAGYDVTAGEENSGEDASTENVADVEGQVSGDECITFKYSKAWTRLCPADFFS